MNTHLELVMVTERLNEARAFAARERLVASLQPTRSAVRALVGLALIKTGRWVAGQAPRRTRQPDRATV